MLLLLLLFLVGVLLNTSQSSESVSNKPETMSSLDPQCYFQSVEFPPRINCMQTSLVVSVVIDCGHNNNNKDTNRRYKTKIICSF